MVVLGGPNPQMFTNDTPEYALYDYSNALTVQKVLSIVSLCFIPVILISNSLVFWSTIFCSHLHTPLNMLFFSLCLSNLCMGCFCIPIFCLNYIDTVGYVIYSSTFHCLLWFAASWISAGGSLVSLLFISIDRYIAIVWPVRYKTCITVKSTIVIMTLIWLYILIVATIPIFDLQNYEENISSAKRCNYFAVIPKYYSFFYTFISIYLCLTVPLILHVLISFRVYKQIIIVNRDFDTLKKDYTRALEEDVSTVIMTVTLSLLFLLLWFPYLITVSFNYFVDFHEKQLENMQDITQVFYFSNAMLNAPLFALVRRDYKLIYLLMLKSAPWNWRNSLAKLEYRRKSYAFRYPSRVSFIRPSVLPIHLHKKVIPVEEAPEVKWEDLIPLAVTEPGHWSVSSLYPLETTIY